MGKILIIKGADFSKVAIDAQPIPPTPPTPPTPTGNLWDEALKDTDIAPLMANSKKVYELTSIISNDGTKTGTPVKVGYNFPVVRFFTISVPARLSNIAKNLYLFPSTMSVIITFLSDFQEAEKL